MAPLLHELSRTVRFCVPFAATAPGAAESTRHNPFAAWPSMETLGAFYEIEVRCIGEPDPVTGYLLNISAIDEAIRETAVPLIQRAVRESALDSPAVILSRLMPKVCERISQSMGLGRSTVTRSPAKALNEIVVRWNLTPYYWVAMTTRTPERALLAQQFEFAAAHRLHVSSLSEAENRAAFGKCNNPNSHGHNYRIEPVVSIPLNSPGTFTLVRLEAIVNEVILQRFDHKHLNMEVKEFAKINPSVENIAKTCFDLLRGPIDNAGGTLEHVTVWETEKTRCTFPAGSTAPVGTP